MELQDFRAYQPGDDVRQVDWNAAARTDQLFVRVRREEVSPVVEGVLDASASMALTPAKAARTRELAWTCCRIARSQGLEPVLVVADDTPRRVRPPSVEAIAAIGLDSRSTLPELLGRGLPMRRSGLRVVVSDLLLDTAPDPLVTRLSRDTSLLVLLQPLDASELDPPEGSFVELVDIESGERLERPISPAVVEEYRARLRTHLTAIETAARRARGNWATIAAGRPLEASFRESLLGNGFEARP